MGASGKPGSIHALIARATFPIGWHGRGQFDKSTTSHLLVRRVIRFKRYMALLRHDMLAFMNRLLQGAEDYLGGDPTLVASNVPTADAFDEAESALESGSKSFRDILVPIGG